MQSFSEEDIDEVFGDGGLSPDYFAYESIRFNSPIWSLLK